MRYLIDWVYSKYVNVVYLLGFENLNTRSGPKNDESHEEEKSKDELCVDPLFAAKCNIEVRVTVEKY